MRRVLGPVTRVATNVPWCRCDVPRPVACATGCPLWTTYHRHMWVIYTVMEMRH